MASCGGHTGVGAAGAVVCCGKCAYNLFGLASDATCPECGLSVRASWVRHRDRVARIARMRRFASVMCCVLVGLMMMQTWAYVVRLPEKLERASWRWPEQAAMGRVVHAMILGFQTVPALVHLLALVVGAWLILTAVLHKLRWHTLWGVGVTLLATEGLYACLLTMSDVMN